MAPLPEREEGAPLSLSAVGEIGSMSDGSKPVSLEVSKCFPVCSRKRTSDLALPETCARPTQDNEL
jgi:hypothetical protein